MTEPGVDPKQPMQQVEEQRAAMQAAQPAERATRLRANYEELVGQPGAIRETLSKEREQVERVAEQLARRGGRIYGVGCGDSWITALAVEVAFEKLLAQPFEALQALEYARYALDLTGPEDAVLGLSASGTTAETLRGLNGARERGAYTVGITMRPDSLFARAAEGVLTAHARRRASFPTQASTTSLALMLAVAAHAGRRHGRSGELAQAILRWLEALPALLEHIIADSEPGARELAARWVDQDVFTFVGAGPGLAAARFGAAKIREGCEGIGWTIGTEEFHHYETGRRGAPFFLVAPDDASYARAVDVAHEVKRVGGTLYSVVAEDEAEIAAASDIFFRIPATPPVLVALPYTLPLQLAAWHISWAKAQRNGVA